MNRNHVWVAGAVAAMLAVSASLAKADDMSTTTTSTTTVTTSAPMASMDKVDFGLLSNHNFNYSDLKGASASGYSDDEIATMQMISEKSGTPFSQIFHRVQGGTTFATLAYESNIPITDIYNTSDEKQKIADYETAYEMTGSGAMKNMTSTNAMMASTDTTGQMPSSTDQANGTNAAMATEDIATIAQSQSNLKTLVKLLKSANMLDTLAGTGPYTVFAPTDSAFRKLPHGTVRDLMANPDKLKSILSYHVIPARIDAASAMAMTSPTSPATLEGGTLQVVTQDGHVMINGATVTKADIMASNGIIHEIDTVLMPDTTTTTTTTTDTTTNTTTTPDAGTTAK